jgi:hypothetical protein
MLVLARRKTHPHHRPRVPRAKREKAKVKEDQVVLLEQELPLSRQPVRRQPLRRSVLKKRPKKEKRPLRLQQRPRQKKLTQLKGSRRRQRLLRERHRRRQASGFRKRI